MTRMDDEIEAIVGGDEIVKTFSRVAVAVARRWLPAAGVDDTFSLASTVMLIAVVRHPEWGQALAVSLMDSMSGGALKEAIAFADLWPRLCPVSDGGVA